MSAVSLEHLTKDDFNFIYEPSEDSFLLIDALLKDVEVLRSSQPSVVVEIGSGSGLVVSTLATHLGSAPVYFATDINPRATSATTRTANAANVAVNAVRTRYVEGLRIAGNIDVLIFNPPYVPTPSAEVGVLPLPASWAGGVDGREVIDPLLETLDSLLSPKGVFYLLLEAANQPQDIATTLLSKGFRPSVLAERKARNEQLYIVKFSRHTKPKKLTKK